MRIRRFKRDHFDSNLQRWVYHDENDPWGYWWTKVENQMKKWRKLIQPTHEEIKRFDSMTNKEIYENAMNQLRHQR